MAVAAPGDLHGADQPCQRAYGAVEAQIHAGLDQLSAYAYYAGVFVIEQPLELGDERPPMGRAEPRREAEKPHVAVQAFFELGA